jgi:hypothetical protein
MGRDAEQIYTSFDLKTTIVTPATEADADTFDVVINRFDTYFVPKRNIIHERAKFDQKIQQQGKSVESFYRAMHEVSQRCGFANKNKEIRNRLVIGIIDNELSIELQLMTELVMESALTKVCESELIKAQNCQPK